MEKSLVFFHKVMAVFLAWGLTCLFGLLLLLAGVLVRLAYKPYDLAPHMPALEEFLFIQNKGGVAFDKLFLHFDGHLSLQGEGVLLLGPQKKPLATARTFGVQLAHEALFKGQIAFRKILLDGLAVRAVQEEKGLWHIGQSVWAAKEDAKQEKQPRKSVEILSFLKEEGGAFSYLEAFSLKNTMAAITLIRGETSQEWQVLDTDLELTQIGGFGFEVESTGVLAHNNATTSFSLRVDQQKGQQARLRAHVSKLDEVFLQAVLPEDFKKALHTTVDGTDVTAKFEEGNFNLTEARLSARFGKTVLNLPDIYTKEKSFRSGNITLLYKPTEKGDVYNVEDFIVEDSNGLMLTASGGFALPKAKKTIFADMLIRVNEASLDEVIAYLPPEKRAVKGLVTWLNESTNHKEAFLRDISLRLKGDLDEARLNYKPTEEKADFLRLNFTFHGLDVRIHPRLEPVVGVSGQAELEGDVLHITSPEGGVLRQQSLKDIDVIISDISQKDKPTLLRGRGVFKGQASGLVPIVEDLFHTQIEVKDLEGTQTSVVDIVIPLERDKQDDLQFSAQTTIEKVSFTLPKIEKLFRAAALKIKATDQDLTLQGDGEVQFLGPEKAWWPTKLKWYENLENIGKETSIEAEITSTDAFLPQLLNTLKGQITGPAHHKLSLKKILAEPDWFQAEIQTDLTNTAVSLKSFGWEKPAAQDLIFKGTGRLHTEGHTLEAEVLEMRGNGVEVLGRGYTKLSGTEKTLEGLTLQFDPFILGTENNAELLYGEDAFRLTGQSFYFDGFASDAPKGEDISLRDGVYDVRLGKLTFKKGVFYDLNTNILREDNHWEMGNIEAKVGKEKAVFTLNLRNREEEQTKKQGKQVELFSADAGAALKALGVYENMQGGQLEGLFNIEKEYSPFGFDGTGHMLVENSYIQNAPTLVRLLSLVSLEQIASAGQGIVFNKIHFPVEMQNRTLFIESGRLKGPNIAMRLAGSFDFAKEEMDLEGALTPASGINSVISKIPLLGPLITGSQGALIVADFSMKGPISAPEISANPLSAVTPGILKDIFGGLFGDGPPKPQKKEAEKNEKAPH